MVEHRPETQDLGLSPLACNGCLLLSHMAPSGYAGLLSWVPSSLLPSLPHLPPLFLSLSPPPSFPGPSLPTFSSFLSPFSPFFLLPFCEVTSQIGLGTTITAYFNVITSSKVLCWRHFEVLGVTVPARGWKSCNNRRPPQETHFFTVFFVHSAPELLLTRISLGTYPLRFPWICPQE